MKRQRSMPRHYVWQTANVISPDESFREYQLAILQSLHGIGQGAYRHTKKLILS